MTESGWTLAWSEPTRLAFAIDHSSRTAVTFRSGETGVVQFDLGQDSRLTVETTSGLRDVVASDLPAGILHGVVGVSTAGSSPTRVGSGEGSASADVDFDETVLTARVTPSAPPDFDETILTRASVDGSTPAADFDETILTARPLDAAPGDAVPRDAVPRDAVPLDPPRLDDSATRASTANSAQITDATGTRIVRLDRALFVGRSPRVPAERASSDGALAFVHSATDHVSATHLLLRDDEGTVLANDLRSTNGTTVAPPVGGPFRLSPGEAVPVAVGTRIRLSDDVVIEILSAEEPGGHRAD